MRSPCRPISISSGWMGPTGERSEISISSSSSSSSRRGENRGSRSAAPVAHRTMLCPSGSWLSITPMQPRKRPPTCKVTKTPCRSPKIPSLGMLAGSCDSETANTIAWRAHSKSDRISSSEGHCILRLLAALKHIELSPLLDTVVHPAPEAQKILRRGNQRAHNHEPKQRERQRFQRRMPCAGNQYRHRAHLQHHLGFPENRGFNRESFGGGDIAQAEDREFAADNNHHHPRGD